MGVDFYSKEASYSCSYNNWHIVRLEVLYATLRYLKHKKESIFQKLEELSNKNGSEKGFDENVDITQYEYDNICYVLDSIPQSEKILSPNFVEDEIVNMMQIDMFIEACSRELRLIDYFVYFNVNGLYALLAKSDCEGYYSAGNSMDILQLLHLILPFIEKEVVRERMKGGIIRLFEDSVKNNSKIKIF